MAGQLVETLNASKVVVAQRIDNVYLGAASPPRDFIIDFAPLITAETARFVGRATVLAAVETFIEDHPGGYFEIVADAGLGKTALAAEITRRWQALSFFTSIPRGIRRPQQFLSHVCAELITRYGLDHDEMPARAGDDTSVLDGLLREALRSGRADRVLLVVDALDEAEEPSAEANPLLLPADLPASVYVVVTHRPGRDLRTLPSTPVRRYVLRRDDDQQRADIEAHLRTEADKNQRVARALAQARPPVPADDFVANLAAASDGNFMYLGFMLADIAESGLNGDLLQRLPQGLPGYYSRFWDRMVEAKEAEGWADWNGLYRPTIEFLCVAGEAVTADWLARQVGRPRTEILERALQRWERLLSRDGDGSHAVWRIVHRSFADFLSEKVDLTAAHVSVATTYDALRREGWGAVDDYGVRHLATHLVEGAWRSNGRDRHALVERLVALVTDPGFQGAHLERLHDPLLLEDDIARAVRAAAGDAEADASLLVTQAALSLLGYRRRQRESQPIFDLARRGEVDAAARRLDLFATEVDQDWHLALLLIIAWLATPMNPDGARRLRDRVRREGSTSPTLTTLWDQVAADAGEGPRPPVHLPPAPSHEVPLAILDRISGAQGDSFLAEFLVAEPGGELHNVSGGRGYLATHDGPLLVAAAAAEPEFGEPLLSTYIAVHSAYGYRQYRQGSLWALLDAVLSHPVPGWARSWASALGQAALAPNRGEFSESLGLAVLSVQASAGDASAWVKLQQRRDRALYDVPAPPPGAPRGAGDTWGFRKRRLAALAEVISRLPQAGAEPQSLLAAAENVGYGFAGFHTMACVALAEAVRVVGAPPSWADRALAAGLQSAHNVQDATFCVRSTARLNALRERWQLSGPGAGTNVAALADRLLEDPSDPRFTGLHVVGERYAGREPLRAMPLPVETLEARSLTALAQAYQRPLTEFVRLNWSSGWAPDQLLDDGVHVNVPDPGLPPLIAAHLSAGVLGSASLPDRERPRVLRTLVPVSAAEPTALYTVLARLLLAWQPKSPATVDVLTGLAEHSAEQDAPDTELAGRLTAFVP